MTKNKRHKLLLQEVHLHNKVLLNDIAALLEVSPDTVRRDIIELEKEGLLIRVHGGAKAKSYQPYNYDTHEIFFHEEKTRVATKGAPLVKPNSVSLISGGTTNLELARVLPDDLDATFFTPSLPIAMQLLERKGIEVIFLGGKLSRDSQIALGGNVLNSLANIKFDNCFLGTSYIDADQGITESEWEVVQLKKAMISSSSRVISLTISEKLGTMQRYKVCDLERIDTLVTELDPADKLLNAYHNHRIEII